MLQTSSLRSKQARANLKKNSLSMTKTVRKFWTSSEKRLIKWLSCELSENPHLERVLMHYGHKLDGNSVESHLKSLRQPIFSEMWY